MTIPKAACQDHSVSAEEQNFRQAETCTTYNAKFICIGWSQITIQREYLRGFSLARLTSLAEILPNWARQWSETFQGSLPTYHLPSVYCSSGGCLLNTPTEHCQFDLLLFRLPRMACLIIANDKKLSKRDKVTKAGVTEAMQDVGTMSVHGHVYKWWTWSGRDFDRQNTNWRLLRWTSELMDCCGASCVNTWRGRKYLMKEIILIHWSQSGISRLLFSDGCTVFRFGLARQKDKNKICFRKCRQATLPIIGLQTGFPPAMEEGLIVRYFHAFQETYAKRRV